MLKKTMTYTDFNGNVRTEDFYFNLTKAEALDFQTSVHGGLSTMLKRLVATEDLPGLMKIFRDLVRASYGVKSDDGRRFMKSEELTRAFVETQAYSDLYTELATNDEEAAKFIKAILPPDLSEAASAAN